MKPYNCVKKISSGSFKNVIYKMFWNHIINIYVLRGFDIEWPTMVHIL